MIYNFLEDFCNIKTTVYIYKEYTDSQGVFQQKPLSKPLRKDYNMADILCSFKLNWLFKDSKYGRNIKEITLKARSYAHGSTEYEDIKKRMPGYTWCGTVKTKDELNEETQEFYEKRCPRSINNMIPNGLVCVEFDDVEVKDIDDLIQKALRNFPHLIFCGRTLSNKLFCIHRANNELDVNNFKL